MPEAPFTSDDIRIEEIVETVAVPPEMRDSFLEAVLEGIETMFGDHRSHHGLRARIDRSNTIEEKISRGIAEILAPRWLASRMSAELAALVTAVMARAVWDFMRASGELREEDATQPAFDRATAAAVSGVLAAIGCSGRDLEAVLKGTKVAIESTRIARARALH